jgi:hypothetical protein
LTHYLSWRQESNAKTVLNQISATKTLTMVKLFAFKNGDGRLKQGEFIVGSSIPLPEVPIFSRVLNPLKKIGRSFNTRYKVILEMMLEMLVSNQPTRK